MVVVTRKHLEVASSRSPNAAGHLAAWFAVAKAARWTCFEDVRNTIRSADLVNGYVVFNIRGNRYRLVTVIHYAKTTANGMTQGHVYVRSVLTHREYDDHSKWDREFGS